MQRSKICHGIETLRHTSTQHDIVILFPSFIEFWIFSKNVCISFVDLIGMAIVTFSEIMNDKKVTI